ncbi:S-layer homology domain-containing protein [Anaerobacillus alkaliphilus]|uniref:S-layer homology domain-containing protein n=1 Tax=Anaerobacillus alkaliphilus TaxID=1548597 RepID=A0A4Q0VVA8_9BACI|nr:S-layer homology domain-containing protein [Anaerobacillus alkaliphilus]RXJ00667.1 S-layer homology domain-containing protein [Anaerobacillus alkaliphilus]
MNRKWIIKLLLAVSLVFVFQQSIFAFSDVSGDPAEKEILKLKERGIAKGMANDIFDPNGKITYATGVTFIVRALDLNIDHMRFIKEPKASDYYTNVRDDKWYASSFINAQFNGIELANDILPEETITKEQFADMLFKALTAKYDLAFITLWMEIDDEADISPQYMESVQKLLISNIAELEDGQFNPKKEISRSEAAVMLYRTVLFVDSLN